MTSCSCKKKQANKRYQDLLKIEFKIKELGKPKHILGARVEFMKNGISLSQRQYIEEIVRIFSFHKGNKVFAPVEPHFTPKKFLESEDKKFNPHLYHQLIESVMQLITWAKLFPNSFQIQLEDTGHWLEK